jgi:hypothetical protein
MFMDISPAFLALLGFFALLGFLHGYDEVEVLGKKYRSAPVTPALLLFLPFSLILAFVVPPVAVMAANMYQAATSGVNETYHVSVNNNNVVISHASKPGLNVGSGVLEPDWIFWVYIIAVGLGIPASYHAGYLIASYILGEGLVPVLIRFPLVKVVITAVEHETVKPLEIAVEKREVKKYGALYEEE